MSMAQPRIDHKVAAAFLRAGDCFPGLSLVLPALSAPAGKAVAELSWHSACLAPPPQMSSVSIFKKLL